VKIEGEVDLDTIKQTLPTGLLIEQFFDPVPYKKN
jgi:hypothetical protein